MVSVRECLDVFSPSNSRQAGLLSVKEGDIIQSMVRARRHFPRDLDRLCSWENITDFAARAVNVDVITTTSVSRSVPGA